MLQISQVLKDQHISQSECARRAGINQTSLSRIINGKEPPYPLRSQRIADALGWKGDPAKLFEEVTDDDTTA